MILCAKNLSLGYGRKLVINNINMEIEKGKISAIIGPNGSGKSTILKAFSRIIKPCDGKVLLNGKDIHKMDTKEVAKQISILSQVREAPDDFTVEDVVKFGRFPHFSFGQKFTVKDKEIVSWAIEKTGLQDFRGSLLKKLSGGEKQRVYIAMALAQKTNILLLDEPTTFLDVSYQTGILDLIKDLNESLNLTVVMVLHDINQAAKYSNKIYALKDGKIYDSGKPEKVLTKDLFRYVFDVEAHIIYDELNNRTVYLF